MTQDEVNICQSAALKMSFFRATPTPFHCAVSKKLARPKIGKLDSY